MGSMPWQVLGHAMKIPKKLHCIWIGDDSKRPDHLLKTWQDLHPDWEYRLWNNDDLYGREWINQSLIDVYLQEGRYPGVADVMRYEILYTEGGFLHPADSQCLHNIEPLFDNQHDAYGVYEQEEVRPGLVSPLYACAPGNAFAKALIDNLPNVPPRALNGTPERPSKAPWQVTGNDYMRRMIKQQNYSGLKIWPSYRFNPIHHTGVMYKGTGKVYAVQQWGSTTDAGIGIKKYNWR